MYILIMEIRHYAYQKRITNQYVKITLNQNA